MTVTTTTRTARYTGDGLNFTFAFNFKILDADHLAVQVINTLTGAVSVIAASNYSVSGIGEESGGSVTYPLTGSAISSDEEIVIERVVPFLQETDILNQEGFFPEVVEDQFDLVVMMIQQIDSQQDRAITIPTIDGTLDMELPPAADRAGKYLSFSSDGTPNLTGAAPSPQYQGAFPGASAPTTRVDGSAIQTGDLYFNTTDNILYVWDGSSWVAVSSSAGAYDINSETVDNIALGDFLPFYDISGSENNKITIENFFKEVMPLLTEETALAIGDHLLFYDLSGTVIRRIDVDDFLNIINTLATVSAFATDDKAIIYDTSAGATRGIELGDLIPSDSFATGLFHVRDEKASGAAGGTFTSGAWQTRTLNTAKTNQISGASLASNQFTLPAGDYYIEATAPCKRGNENQLRLRNITDGTTQLVGANTNANSDDTSRGHSLATLSGRFSLAAAKTFELQHRCALTRSADGFGEANSFGEAEVYAEVRVWSLGHVAGLNGGVSINTQTGTSYTLAAGDADNIVEMNNASANTVTIPTNASVPFPIGTIITITQLGAGATTVQGDTGVTVNGTSAGSAALSAQYDGVSLYKRDTDVWIMQGAHVGVT